MSKTNEHINTDEHEVTPFALQYAEEIEGSLKDLEKKHNSMNLETLPPPID